MNAYVFSTNAIEMIRLHKNVIVRLESSSDKSLNITLLDSFLGSICLNDYHIFLEAMLSSGGGFHEYQYHGCQRGYLDNGDLYPDTPRAPRIIREDEVFIFVGPDDLFGLVSLSKFFEFIIAANTEMADVIKKLNLVNEGIVGPTYISMLESYNVKYEEALKRISAPLAFRG